MKRLNQTGAGIGVTLLAICVVGFVGFAIWNFVQTKSKGNQLQPAQSVQQTADKVAKTVEQTAQEKIVTEDEKVLAAAEAYCEAELIEGSPAVFTGGTSQGKKVRYYTDRNFAYVNAACTTKADVGEGGNSAAYILKKVNGLWLVIDRGQQGNPSSQLRYGIPSSLE